MGYLSTGHGNRGWQVKLAGLRKDARGESTTIVTNRAGWPRRAQCRIFLLSAREVLRRKYDDENIEQEETEKTEKYEIRSTKSFNRRTRRARRNAGNVKGGLNSACGGRIGYRLRSVPTRLQTSTKPLAS